MVGPALRLSGTRAAAALLTAVVIAACGSGGASTSASRGASPRRTVLVLTQTKGYHHASIPAAGAALRRLAARDGRYRLVFLPSAAQLTPAALRHASAVVFLLTTGELPMNASDKRGLVAFVRRGGGLVGFHSATDTFHHWDAYKRMIGAEFSHHSDANGRVIVEDRDTPATRRLPRAFTIHEEFYVFTHDPRPHVHVLARLDTHGGADRPLVWCRRFGAGRVFYDALGHFIPTWSNPDQLTLAAGGLDWATGLANAPRCAHPSGSS